MKKSDKIIKTIKFRKAKQDFHSYGPWEAYLETPDYTLLKSIINICERWNSKVISHKFRDASSIFKSQIKIECDPQYINNIYIDFLDKFTSEIERTSIK